jgi:hypothetical protein
MDDGQQVKRGGVILCTDSYNLTEITLLRDALQTNFNIKTTVHVKRGKNEAIYNRIYIAKASLEIIKPFIKPYFHESLIYKIES